MMDRCDDRCVMGDYRGALYVRCEGWAAHSGAHWHTMDGCEPVAVLRWALRVCTAPPLTAAPLTAGGADTDRLADRTEG